MRTIGVRGACGGASRVSRTITRACSWLVVLPVILAVVAILTGVFGIDIGDSYR
jgi:hypothetical protein